MQFCYEQRHFSVSRESSGRNIHVPLVETEADSLWFGKICCPLNEVWDFNEREIIASAFARWLSLPVPEVVMVNLPQDVANFNDLKVALLEFANKDCGGLVKIGWSENGRLTNWFEKLFELQSGQMPWVRMVAVRWVAGATPLRNWSGEIERLRNLESLLQSIVFNLWFGNHDGNMDLNVIADNTDAGWCIDFGYSGPGQRHDMGVNVNGNKFDDFGTTRRRRYYNKLLPSRLIDFVQQQSDGSWTLLEPMVERIASLSERELHDILHNTGCQLALAGEGKTNAAATVKILEELSRRQLSLRGKVRWFCENARSIEETAV
jgi:hypothetical protein